jgi:hypothetical protein
MKIHLYWLQHDYDRYLNFFLYTISYLDQYKIEKKSEVVEQFQNSENLQTQNSEPESPESLDENYPLLASA